GDGASVRATLLQRVQDAREAVRHGDDAGARRILREVTERAAQLPPEQRDPVFERALGVERELLAGTPMRSAHVPGGGGTVPGSPGGSSGGSAVVPAAGGGSVTTRDDSTSVSDVPAAGGTPASAPDAPAAVQGKGNGNANGDANGTSGQGNSGQGNSGQ